MITAVADTHALHWYLFDDHQLSNTARDFLDQAQANQDVVAVSSITIIELTYLTEKKRVSAELLPRVLEVLADPTTIFYEISLDNAVARAVSRISREQVPDMPDRIIAATALYLNVPVISRDSKIKLSTIETIW